MNTLYDLVPVGAYLVGGFPTGVVLSRRKFGIDVREMGSGNIGATNVTRNFGWWAGVLVFLVDFLKGFLPLLLLIRFLPAQPWLVTASGTALVLGHCFSPYLRLHGGKGVATSLGCLLAVAPLAALVAAICYLLCLVTTRISAIGSLVGMSGALLVIAIQHPPTPTVYLVGAIALIVFVRHRTNMKRLLEDFKKR